MKTFRLLLAGLSILLLTGCGRFVVQVNLTPEERAKDESIIVEYQAKLRNWDPNSAEQQKEADAIQGNAKDNPPTVVMQTPQGPKAVDSKNVQVETTTVFEPRPPFQWFLKIARAQEDLGYLSDALDTYKKGMAIYEFSQVAWNNMGHLEEQMGHYDAAIGYYQQIIDQFGFTQYYIDIANAYVKKGDSNKAQSAYNQYRLITKKTDLGMEQQIQSLREKK